MFLVQCNGTEIPDQIAKIVAFIYNAIRIAVPLLLIIVGMFEMAKAVTAGKEDEIKKAQGLLVKKAVAAVLVFLMMSIVQLVINVVAGDDPIKDNMWTCINNILHA